MISTRGFHFNLCYRGAQQVTTFEKGRGRKFFPCLEGKGGRGTQSFGPYMFPLCSPPAPSHNDRSLRDTYTSHFCRCGHQLAPEFEVGVLATVKTVTSDTLTVENHHSWAAKGWSWFLRRTPQIQRPSAAFTGEF